MFKQIKEIINKKIDDINFINATNNAATVCNHDAFLPIKGILNNQDVALCGAGPTLNNYVPIEECVHIALNRSILNEKIRFDYFIADDWDGVFFFKDFLKEYKCKKFFGHQIGDYSREIPESFLIENNASRYYTDSYIFKDGFKSKFICDIDKQAIGNMPNIALSAMQIVLYMNPKKIYLVGCDASQGHFTQKGLNQLIIARHEKDMSEAVSSNRVIEKWIELKKFANAYYPGTEIVSINPVGLKGIFKDLYQNEK